MPLTYLMRGTYHTLKWIRIVGDLVFLIVGPVPLSVTTMKLALSKEMTETA